MKIGNKEFDFNKRTYIMGILNVTDDSFSDGGSYKKLDLALFHAQQMIDEGADIIDIGGESTRPGYVPVSEDEELERVLPVLCAIKKRFDVPVSVDTYKAGVAKESINAGADLINDIWGLQHDDEMGRVISQGNVACCLMHNRKAANYDNFLEDFMADMKKIIESAKNFGIEKDKIILDPGIGFAKDTKQNLIVLNNLERLTQLGYPWLLGASRKSVIGNTLNLPAGERLEGTIATTVIGVMKGAAFVRVHDVMPNKRAADMARAVILS